MRASWTTLLRVSPAAWLAWGAWTLAGAVLLTQWQINRLDQAFQTDARIVHRLLSQSVVQHDAILNTLALLQPGTVGADTPEARLPALFPQLIAVYRRAPGQSWPDPGWAPAEAASRSLNRPVLAALDLPHGRFALVRAAHPASYALTVNLATLAPGADWPMDIQTSPVRVTLEEAGGSYVVQPGSSGVDAVGGWPLTFRKALGSESQAFDVVARRRMGWAELPWMAMLAGSTLGALIWTGLASWRRQRAARQRAEELLRLGRVARLNTLGELAAGIAHELNQPLTAVLAGTQAALRLLNDDGDGLDLPTARHAMQQSVAQARRAAEVLARLRRTVEAPTGDATAPIAKSIHLAEAARHALALLKPDLERLGVSATLQVEAPVLARVDAVVLEQILHNLLGNALQALGQVPADERRLTLRVCTDAAHACLSVADTGVGIKPELLERIFEPFFTTHEGGLGLGLSLCETLASGQGGTLTAAAHPPRGALFTLALPLPLPPDGDPPA